MAGEVLQPSRLVYGSELFRQQLDALLAWESVSDTQVQSVVADIVQRVRTEGDAALLEFTHTFDHLSASSLTNLTLEHDRLQAALNSLPAEQREALETAAERIRNYHQKAGAAGLELSRRRWHDFRAAFYSARQGGAVCSRRSGCLSILGIDECHSRQCCRCSGSGYGCANSWRGGE